MKAYAVNLLSSFLKKQICKSSQGNVTRSVGYNHDFAKMWGFLERWNIKRLKTTLERSQRASLNHRRQSLFAIFMVKPNVWRLFDILSTESYTNASKSLETTWIWRIYAEQYASTNLNFWQSKEYGGFTRTKQKTNELLQLYLTQYIKMSTEYRHEQ